MRTLVKLLLAVLVLCAACDAVGLGGGTGDEGSVNLVGTTWRGTHYYDEWSDYGDYYSTTTFTFTSRTGGRGTTVMTDEPMVEFTFEYSISGNRITITAHAEGETAIALGDIEGDVINMDLGGVIVPLYKI